MRDEFAFNTKDPLLLAVGQAYRDSVEQQWDYDTTVAAIQDAVDRNTFIHPPAQVMVARPQNVAVVASSPTVVVAAIETEDSELIPFDYGDDRIKWDSDPEYFNPDNDDNETTYVNIEEC